MADDEPLDLDLTRLPRIWNLDEGLLAVCVRSAAVMLQRFHDRPPAPGRVVRNQDTERIADVNWRVPTEVEQRSFLNHKDATEDGAYAVAFAVAHALERYVVVMRAEQLTGCDYLLVREGEPENDFVKLEVSGLATGTDGEVRERLREKVGQVGGGTLVRPGLAVVVRFERVMVVTEDVP